MRALKRRVCLRAQDGYTMIVAISAMFLMSLMVAGAVIAVEGDIGLTRNDLHQKQSLEAARTGLADYAFHLNADSNYWTYCKNAPQPNALNDEGSTANRRPVPGSTGATYAIELLPANGAAKCDSTQPINTMIELGAEGTGTFRIRSTGFSGDSERSFVATFKKSSFLDFIYFTQYETPDPSTYSTSADKTYAANNCEQYRREGRPIGSGGNPCIDIYFIDGEKINGPLHTNDELRTCGAPTFGRTVEDSIEVSAPQPGWSSLSGCGSTAPNFIGTYKTAAPVLTPPPTNSVLKREAGSEHTWTGPTMFTVNGNQIEVRNGSTVKTIPFPPDGVVYVQNGTCNPPYPDSFPHFVYYDIFNSDGSGFRSGCGTAYVKGSYTGRLTVGAENDIVVWDDLTRSQDGMMGLVANNFVRVAHGCQTNYSWEQNERRGNFEIDAAILAIQHSFIVDEYRYCSAEGTLKVNGAIAQKFRGPVGTFSGSGPVSGYSKDYNYDDRLRYVSPPHFLDPVETAWSIQRQTQD